MSNDRGKFLKRVAIPAEASFTTPADLNKKLDKILKAISNLTERIDVIDKRFDNFESRLDEFERSVSYKISNIENQSKMKAERNSLQKVMVRLEKLEESKNVQEIANVMQESYEKRFNILIHGIAETTDSSWENPGQTTALVRTFLTDGLLIQEPESVAFVTCHRLSQRFVFRGGVKKSRIIIVKLTNTMDKRLIFRSLGYLRRYSKTRRSLNVDSIYISEHLLQ